MDDSKNLLIELLKLASEKEIPYTQSQLKKMSQEQLEQVYKDYKLKELDEVNETIADVIIIKFEDVLKSSQWIKSDSQLASRLQERKMFKRDLKNIVSWFTPILPYIGILEGTMVIATEVIEKYAEDNTKNVNDESNSPQTEKGDEQSESKTSVA